MVIIFLFSGCKDHNGHSEIVIPKISEFIDLGEEREADEHSHITGTYLSEDLLGKNGSSEKILIAINEMDQENIKLKVSLIANQENLSISFDVFAQKKKDHLYTMMLNGKSILLVFRNQKLSIKPEKPEDIGVLTNCWSWGTSLAGNYKKI